MKYLIYAFIVILPVSSLARDPGTGSNTTNTGAGPVTPDSASGDTSIMGGGTPGNEGIDTFSVDDPSREDLKRIKQAQEELQEERERNKNKNKK